MPNRQTNIQISEVNRHETQLPRVPRGHVEHPGDVAPPAFAQRPTVDARPGLLIPQSGDRPALAVCDTSDSAMLSVLSVVLCITGTT
jgi:hypothetical protein